GAGDDKDAAAIVENGPHTALRHFDVGRPGDRVDHEPPEIRQPPILEKMPPGESKPAPVIRPFDDPGDDVLAVGPCTVKQNRDQPGIVLPETEMEIKLLRELKRMNAPRHRVRIR